MNRKKAIEKVITTLNIMDDSLFEKMAEDVEFCEEMLATVLQQKVKVEKVVPQKSVRNLQGRSVILDAYCILEDGTHCNVEVQKSNDDNHEKRMRYNTSCLTANITDPGTEFENVPDVIGIFISKFDYFQEGKTIYHIDRIVRETGSIRDNGLQEIYVNTKIDDGSDIAGLMKIFNEQEAYDFKRFPKTSERKKQFLQEEGGKKEMNELLEQLIKQEKEEEACETAKKLFENGVDFDIVKKSITIIPEVELRKIYNKVVLVR